MITLLCHDGRLLNLDAPAGRIVPRPLEDATLSPLDIGDAAFQAFIGFSHFLQGHDETLDLVLPSGPLAGWRLSRSPDRRSVVLTQEGRALAAPPGASELSRTEDPSAPECWFLPLTATDLTILRGLTGARWLNGHEAPQQVVLMPGFFCRVGSCEINLGWNLPFDPSAWPHRVTVLQEGWRMRHLHRYRPLVYVTAYGAPAGTETLRLCLASLLSIGRYDGDVLVITDRPPAAIDTLAPSGLKGRLAVLPTAAGDTIGHRAARFAITGWPGAWDFQPLLHVDADTLFDRPVAPLLHAIARSDRIAAQPDPWERLVESDRVGRQLILADGGAPDPDLCGFSTGILGIPNMAAHGATLRLMGRVLQNRLTLCGRDSLPFADQAVANYVACQSGQVVDTALMAPFVRLANAGTGPERRRGVVRFCLAPDGMERVEAMRRYFSWLLALSQPGDPSGRQ